ncbi:MAG: UTP--glucose-1-phosphate uridylyltransferase, partial [Deltaproteobacteria bacterium]|nr:UTP--glucose-1-phosphate uridylyltransferase [Deltaproteobacteria bacterium]
NEPFAAMVGDDLIIGEDAGLPQLIAIAEREKKSVVGVMEVPADKVNRYGIVAGREMQPGLYDITDMVEKPDVDKAPSRLAIVGRYVLMPEIFDYLAKAKPGHGGEIQLTDALFALCKAQGMLAVKMNGIRFDAGDWVDYLAANVYFGLKDDTLRADLAAKLHTVLGEN